MSEQHRREYLARIHRAQDYIERNLTGDLSLEAIARQACFSPFHFHRIYSAVTGETLYQFILRLRLEKAAGMLCARPPRSVTEVALDCGFGSSAAFARAFRNLFGVSASEYRKKCKTLRKEGEEGSAGEGYSDHRDAGSPGRRWMMSEMMQPPSVKQPIQVQVKDLPARTLAYVRHVGPYAGNADLFGQLWQRLLAWAGPRDLVGRPGAEMITIYHDNPEVTEEQNLRISVGLTVPPQTETGGEVNLLELPEGRYVLARFELDSTEYAAAWTYVMGVWLPESGYQCDDRPHYEAYAGDPEADCSGRHVVEICVPIRPL